MIPGSVGWARVWADLSAERYDDRFRLAMLHAISESRSRGHSWLGVEHLFIGCVVSDPGLYRAFTSIADPIDVMGRAMDWAEPEHVSPEPPLKLAGDVMELWMSLERAHRGGRRKHPVATLRAQRVLDRAVGIAADAVVSVHHLFLAVIEEPGSVIAAVLTELGVPRARVDGWVRARLDWGPLLDLAREAADDQNAE